MLQEAHCYVEMPQPPGNHSTSRACFRPAYPSTPERPRSDIAPHDVFYAPERRLWYCDIEID
jgi:hypothetical protein